MFYFEDHVVPNDVSQHILLRQISSVHFNCQRYNAKTVGMYGISNTVQLLVVFNPTVSIVL